MIGKVLESGMKVIDHLRSSVNGKRNADEADTIVAWHLPKRAEKARLRFFRATVFPFSSHLGLLGPIAVDSLPSRYSVLLVWDLDGESSSLVIRLL